VAQAAQAGPAGPANGAARPPAELNGTQIGLQAARRAVQRFGERPSLTDPVIVEVEPRGNVAVGRAAWGLAPWAPVGTVRRIAAAPLAAAVVDTAVVDPASAGPVPIPLEEGEKPAEEATAADILAAAAGRSLVLVVRDAHRSPATQNLVTSVLADRPDAVVVEMGLPVWRPAAGSYRAYLATWGAARVNAQAAAEVLGLIPGVGLPARRAGLPARPAGLPARPAGLPARPAGLPARPAGLPVRRAGLRTGASAGRGCRPGCC
jgi:beta-N-acetylhexosaminidase